MIAAVGLGAKCCADQHEDCSSTDCWPWLTCMEYEDAGEQPLQTCEIPCGEDVDCPIGQQCVDVAPGPGLVCMECTMAGEQTEDPSSCCGWLTAVRGCLPGEECDGYWCVDCGDGLCGVGESPWECPADCEDCSSLGLDEQACAASTVGYWAGEQRRRTAEELAVLAAQACSSRPSEEQSSQSAGHS
ncbi:MAG: hypothetical protein R6V85_05865, partial [Polyangia bacterium]